jgi:ferri-bacillibactin esterase
MGVSSRPDGGESPLPGAEVRSIDSEHVGDEFKILVGRPSARSGPPRSVLFVSDPSIAFGTAFEVARLLGVTGDLPPLLVVGIGYPGDRMLALRQRDLTPTVTATYADVPDPAMMAGADRFVGFIRDELKPWVKEEYGVDARDSAFVGNSLGGLFATHVLLTRPSTFRRYGIGSPAYWWDDGVIFKTEARYAEHHSNLRADVYLSVGAYETPSGVRRYIDQLPAGRRREAMAKEAEDPSPDIVGQMLRMVECLRSRAYPALTMASAIFEGEYHQTAIPMNLSRALRNLYRAPL